MTLPRIIAIDGPAGSGKSTISARLAKRFGYLFIDTGIFYRTLTFIALQEGTPLDDHEALTQLAENTTIDIVPAPDDSHHDSHVFANDQNVTDHLRSAQVEAAVSTVSSVAGVRHALLSTQWNSAQKGNIIMAGRDIGTVVLPDADLKLFLDASLEERARRRLVQHQVGVHEADASLDEIIQALARRDKIDTERAVSPLKRSDDAIYLLTDGRTIDETVDIIIQTIEAWEKTTEAEL